MQVSWSDFVVHRDDVVDALARQFRELAPSSVAAAVRACWLFAAVEELVELLPAPSRLELHARDLGASWPDPSSSPTYAIEGRAWMAAGAACIGGWSPGVERAWRQAWLLLSDVLAAETLSPFSDRGD